MNAAEVEHAQAGETPDREALLLELRRVTAEALGRARAGNADPDALAEAVATREALFEQLGALAGPVSARMRALAHEITMLDRTLIAWCEQTQRGVARSFVKRSRRAIEYRSPQPRIISQEA